jgi:hypothetical protein
VGLYLSVIETNIYEDLRNVNETFRSQGRLRRIRPAPR